MMKIRPRGGPWNRSMRVVHGPGPWTRSTVHRVVHGPGSMFCIRPAKGARSRKTDLAKIGKVYQVSHS